MDARRFAVGKFTLATERIRIASRLALATSMAIIACGCADGGSRGGGTPNVGAAMDLYNIETGVGGFPIHGATYESAGQRVAVLGDVNGDGMDDVGLGVPYSLFNQTIGGALVVFGKSDTAPVESSDIFDGFGGFKIIGVDGFAGYALSAAGDVNGDGLADIVIGSQYASLGGQAQVVYGKATTTPVFLDAVIAGNGGFSVYGPPVSGYFGSSVGAAGDFNGDGFDDVVVGDPYWRPEVLLFPQSGAAYIVYGQADARDDGTRGAAGIRQIVGVEHGDQCGTAVSGAGDVNGDGFDDVLIGAYSAETTERPDSGESYVVFGGTGTSTINLSDISNGIGGFVIRGAFPFDHSGVALSSAGDVNNDTLADVIIGVPNSDVSGVYLSGAAYVVFGRTGTAPVDLYEIESSSQGFLIYGTHFYDHAGSSVSGAGDVNGDGFDDVIVGAPGG